MKVDLEFIKTHPDAQLPRRNHHNLLGTGDSGYDVFATEDATIPANSYIKVDVGLKIANIPNGYWIRMESRSGLFFKFGIEVFNGIIDNQYRGILGVGLKNHSVDDYRIKKGDRICQIIVYPLIDAKLEFVEEVSQTERGESGFGSSGN